MSEFLWATSFFLPVLFYSAHHRREISVSESFSSLLRINSYLRRDVMCSSDSPPSSSLMMKSLSLSSRGSTGKLLRKMSRRVKDFCQFSPKARKLPASLHQLLINVLDLWLHLRNYSIFYKHPRGHKHLRPIKSNCRTSAATFVEVSNTCTMKEPV